jgi:hypothetical protein
MANYSGCQLGVLTQPPFNFPKTGNKISKGVLNDYCTVNHDLGFTMGKYGNCKDNDKNFYTCAPDSNNNWVWQKSKNDPILPVAVVSKTVPSLGSGVFTIQYITVVNNGGAYLSPLRTTSTDPYVKYVPQISSVNTTWIVNNVNGKYTIQDSTTAYYLVNTGGNLSLTSSQDTQGWNILTLSGVNDNIYYQFKSNSDGLYLNYINGVLSMSTNSGQTSNFVISPKGTLPNPIPTPVPICNTNYTLTDGVCKSIAGNVCTTGTDPNGATFVYKADGTCVPEKCNTNYSLIGGVCTANQPPPAPPPVPPPVPTPVPVPSPAPAPPPAPAPTPSPSVIESPGPAPTPDEPSDVPSDEPSDEPAPVPTPAPKSKTGLYIFLILFLLLIMGGAGFFWMKVLKR